MKYCVCRVISLCKGMVEICPCAQPKVTLGNVCVAAIIVCVAVLIVCVAVLGVCVAVLIVCVCSCTYCVSV